jgi:hypothetical protein
MTLLGSGARSRRSFAAMMHMVHRGGPRGVVDRMFELAKPAELMRSPRGEISSAHWCCEFRKHSVRVALF